MKKYTNEEIKTFADGYYAGNADWLNKEQEQDTKVGWRQGFAYALRQFAVSSSVCSCGSPNYGYGYAKCYDCGKIKDVLGKIENPQKTDTIKTTFDLRTCFVNMQNDEGAVILDKTQWEEICKLVEK